MKEGRQTKRRKTFLNRYGGPRFAALCSDWASWEGRAAPFAGEEKGETALSVQG